MCQGKPYCHNVGTQKVLHLFSEVSLIAKIQSANLHEEHYYVDGDGDELVVCKQVIELHAKRGEKRKAL